MSEDARQGSASRFELAMRRRAARLGMGVDELIVEDRIRLHSASLHEVSSSDAPDLTTQRE